MLTFSLHLPLQDKIKDHLGYMTAEAALLLELGSVNEAEHLYRKLLALNPDNYHIHEALQRCQGLQPQIGEDGHGLSDEPRRRLTELYVELLSSYPRSMACQRIPLTFKVTKNLPCAQAPEWHCMRFTR